MDAREHSRDLSYFLNEVVRPNISIPFSVGLFVGTVADRIELKGLPGELNSSFSTPAWWPPNARSMSSRTWRLKILISGRWRLRASASAVEKMWALHVFKVVRVGLVFSFHRGTFFVTMNDSWASEVAKLAVCLTQPGWFNLTYPWLSYWSLSICTVAVSPADLKGWTRSFLLSYLTIQEIMSLHFLYLGLLGFANGAKIGFTFCQWLSRLKLHNVGLNFQQRSYFTHGKNKPGSGSKRINPSQRLVKDFQGFVVLEMLRS